MCRNVMHTYTVTHCSTSKTVHKMAFGSWDLQCVNTCFETCGGHATTALFNRETAAT